MPTTGKVGESWYKIQGPNRPEECPGSDYVAYDFGFQICLPFVPEMSASFTSYIGQIIYTGLAWILYPLHFSLLPLS